MQKKAKLDFRVAESLARTVEDARSRLLVGKQDNILNRKLLSHQGLSPKFSRTANGCRVTDTLGHSLIDWTGSRSSNLLGHRHPVVVDAIATWAAEGTTDDEDFPDSHEGSYCDPRETLLATTLAGLFQSGDVVGFTRGYREALFSAIEIARIASGRKRILWPKLHENRELYDESQVFRFGQTGEPNTYRIAYPFNDLEHIDKALEKDGDEIGTIVLRPFAYLFPDVNYYRELESRIAERDMILIVDESDTAFRFEMGGAQKHFNLSPDLTVVGDTLAGHFSFAAVIGKSERIGNPWPATVRQLDRPSGLTMSVAQSTLQFVIEENLPSRLHTISEQLRDEFALASKAHGIECELVGYANRLSLQFNDTSDFTQSDQRNVFTSIAMDNGILTHGEFWPNASHDDQAVDETIRALEATLESFAKVFALKTNRVIASGLSGDPSEEKQKQRSSLFHRVDVRGRIDTLMMIRKTLVVTGWILINELKVDELVAVLDDGSEIVAEPIQRTDLTNAFPQLTDAVNAGFTMSLPVESIKKTSRFLLVAKSKGVVEYQTLLIHDPSLQTCGPYPFGDETIFS